MAKKAMRKKTTTGGGAPKRTTQGAKKGASAQPTRTHRPVRRRRSDYNYADDSGGYTGVPPGDMTTLPSANVEIVRPDWSALDCLIFRPLPCLTDDWKELAEARFMPYRTSPDPKQFTDWIRNYPAVKSVGMPGARVTFLAYDRHMVRNEPNFDKSQLPYQLIWDWATDAKKKRRFPNMDWLDLTDGRECWLARPATLVFVQALIFKKGAELFVGQGQVVKGLGKEDLPQIVQMSGGAGYSLEKMLNIVNPEADPPQGSAKDKALYWERMMRYGDPVLPQKGRFIRLQNPAHGPTGGGVDVSDLDDNWQMGEDDYARRDSRDKQGPKGYDVSIDEVLIVDGQRTTVKPVLKPEALVRLKPKIVFWDEVLRVPTIEEQCLILAKAFKGARAMLTRAWADHPEYFTDDVKAVLKEAEQKLQWTRESSSVGGTELGFEEAGEEGEVVAGDPLADDYGDEFFEDDELEGEDADVEGDDAEGEEEEYAEGDDDDAEGEDAGGEEEYDEGDDADVEGDEGEFEEDEFDEGEFEEGDDALDVDYEFDDADDAEGDEEYAEGDDDDYEDDAPEPQGADEEFEEDAAEADEFSPEDFADDGVTEKDRQEMDRAFAAANRRSSQRRGTKKGVKKRTAPKSSQKAAAPAKGAKKGAKKGVKKGVKKAAGTAKKKRSQPA